MNETADLFACQLLCTVAPSNKANDLKKIDVQLILDPHEGKSSTLQAKNNVSKIWDPACRVKRLRHHTADYQSCERQAISFRMTHAKWGEEIQMSSLQRDAGVPSECHLCAKADSKDFIVLPSALNQPSSWSSPRDIYQMSIGNLLLVNCAP